MQQAVPASFANALPPQYPSATNVNADNDTDDDFSRGIDDGSIEIATKTSVNPAAHGTSAFGFLGA
ncbi:MAG: hypothetical protein WDM89_13360 [Rhizomicrobium sp.]